MPRAESNKLYRTFVKGLVTEASPLTYPEDTSYAELNTILSRRGSRTRRKGQTYNNVKKIPAAEITDFSFAQNEFVWKAVARQPNTNFLCVQKGRTLHFVDLGKGASENGTLPFTVDLSDYLRPGADIALSDTNLAQMAAGQGFLFVVTKDTEPLYISYDPSTNTIQVFKITILIRDFEGLKDGLANDEEPLTLTKEHHYNLMNQGWLYGTSSTSTFSTVSYTDYTFNPLSRQYALFAVENGEETTFSSFNQASPTDGPIFRFKNVIGRYPGNNKQWWVARAEADDPDKNIKAGDFLPEVLDRLFSGNNRAPRGHYILNAFRKDRSLVSGVSDLGVDDSQGRPETVAFFSGRAWYGAGSTVYFSQILDNKDADKAGLCFQEADPTAEDISDLIQSDGGVVPIPEIDRITRLMPLANGVLVFALNGVWFISGGDSAFAATGIAVDKVSSIGTKSPLAATEVDGTLFWWSDTGIQAMQQATGQFGPIPGKFGNTNISEQTIQTLYNQIPELGKICAKVEFDPRNNRLLWLYNDKYSGKYRYNKCLLFDLTLQAFFLWEFGDITDGPVVTGIYNNVNETFSESSETVLADGDTVEVDSGDEVIVEGDFITYAPSSIEYTVNVPAEGMVFSETEDASFADWASFDGIGIGYESFVETGYELNNDTMRDKQAVYVFVHFRQEDNSSCKMTTKWDWCTSRTSNRWSTEVEAYRARIRPNPTTADLEAFEVVTSKNKVRGNGKAVQFKFGTDEIGKNFQLLGWAVAFSGNTKP